MASNVLRGAFGSVATQSGLAARWLLDPLPGSGPSGLADAPRPFVFRSRHLDSQTVRDFWFDVHLFDGRPEVREQMEAVFRHVAEEGLGPGRERIEYLRASLTERALDLRPVAQTVTQVHVRFWTPTELKSEVSTGFGALIRRLTSRISNLRAMYQDGPLEIDFRGLVARADAVRTRDERIEPRYAERYSSRTHQTHDLSGFVGTIAYEGENLGPFLPYLKAGSYTGAGRQTVWGKGEIEVIEAI